MLVIAGGETVCDLSPDLHLQLRMQDFERDKGFETIFQGVEHDPSEIAVNLDRFLTLELLRVGIAALHNRTVAAGDDESAGPWRRIDSTFSQEGNAVHRRPIGGGRYRQCLFALRSCGQAQYLINQLSIVGLQRSIDAA